MGEPNFNAANESTTMIEKEAIQSNILFRHVCPTDLPKIYNLERSSYPKDEAASKSQIQYRQHHAAPFFRCAVCIPSADFKFSANDNDNSGTASGTTSGTASGTARNEGEGGNSKLVVGDSSKIKAENDVHLKKKSNNVTSTSQETEKLLSLSSLSSSSSPPSSPHLNLNLNLNLNLSTAEQSRNSLNEIGNIIGFITATRCTKFTEESMKTHDSNGPLLAIHSVVIDEQFRNAGIGSAMLQNYIKVVEEMMQTKINTIRKGGGSGNSIIGVKKSSSGSNLSQLQPVAATATATTQQANDTNLQKHQNTNAQTNAYTNPNPPQKKNWNLISKIVLMSKIQNLPFYIKAGFQVVGKSPIEHGQDEWYNCIKPLQNVCDFIKEKDDLYEEQLKRFQLTQMMMKVEREMQIEMKEREKAMINEVEWMKNQSSTINGSAGMSCWTVDSFAIPNNTSSPTTEATTASTCYIKGSGNPAGVVMIPSGADSPYDPESTNNVKWMQTVAIEFNLSETAFIWKKHQEVHNSSDKNDGNNNNNDNINSNHDDLEYFIRYYTCNGTEVDLCGHATLAASSVIFQEHFYNRNNDKNTDKEDKKSLANEIIFHAKNNVILKAREKLETNNGTLPSSSSSSSLACSIEMEFPTKQLIEFTKGSTSYTNIMAMMKESLFPSSSSLSNSSSDIIIANDSSNEMKTTFNIDDGDVIFVGVDDAADDLFIELSPHAFAMIPSDASLINFKPMYEVKEYNRGVIISCLAALPNNDTDKGGGNYLGGVSSAIFQSRFFGPKVGIDEDPVTGSAHCVLGPYYSSKLGRKDVVGYQKSLRGGIVECQMLENEEAGGNDSSSREGEVIQIAGTAVTAMSGTLFM